MTHTRCDNTFMKGIYLEHFLKKAMKKIEENKCVWYNNDPDTNRFKLTYNDASLAEEHLYRMAEAILDEADYYDNYMRRCNVIYKLYCESFDKFVEVYNESYDDLIEATKEELENNEEYNAIEDEDEKQSYFSDFMYDGMCYTFERDFMEELYRLTEDMLVDPRFISKEEIKNVTGGDR